MSAYHLIIVFVTVFLAELGDKTQLATLFLSADEKNNPWLVFMAASLALTASTALAVLVGSFAASFITAIPVKLLAGIGFLLIGGFMVYEHIKGAA